MGQDPVMWPYVPTLIRLALASAIGLFIGIERERRRKEAGLRTFAFAALLGGVGGLLDDRFALLALGLIGILVIFLNVETIHTGEGAEITTSAALMVTGFAGVLAGQGHTFTPTVLGIATAALLAWKEPLAGFSVALTESEFRSAVLLAIVAFVVYPVLPPGSVDPWQLVEPRSAWITVILIAALGFTSRWDSGATRARRRWLPGSQRHRWCRIERERGGIGRHAVYGRDGAHADRRDRRRHRFGDQRTRRLADRGPRWASSRVDATSQAGVMGNRRAGVHWRGR